MEVRRWSEGEIKAKTPPNQAGRHIEIKANKTKTKQNKVNQGCGRVFPSKRVDFTQYRPKNEPILETFPKASEEWRKNGGGKMDFPSGLNPTLNRANPTQSDQSNQ